MKKLVVVTGGSKGIGRAIVAKFREEGFEVAVCSRSKTKLQELESDYPGVFTFEADVSIKEEVEAFANYVLGLNIPIHVLVNNAGVFLPGKFFEEPEENLKIQMDTNLYSAVHMTRNLIEELKSQESAHIFNICSIASIMAYASSASYAISKFALLGFSKCIRDDLKESSVKVTAVLPGATFTDSWAGVDIPESRFIAAEDVANAVFGAFALSKSAVVEELIIRPQLGDL